MTDAVTWQVPVPARPPGGTLLQVPRAVLGFVVALVTDGSAGRRWMSPDPLRRTRLPRNADQELRRLRCLMEYDVGPALLAGSSGRGTLHLSAEKAWITAPGARTSHPLDLAALRLDGLATVAGAGLTVTSVDTVCVAAVSGAGTQLRIRGPWLGIAWLGHLAGWPDPGLDGAERLTLPR